MNPPTKVLFETLHKIAHCEKLSWNEDLHKMMSLFIDLIEFCDNCSSNEMSKSLIAFDRERIKEELKCMMPLLEVKAQ